jgi:hypothetical protein
MSLEMLPSPVKEVHRTESEWTMIYPHEEHPISIRRSRSGPKLYLRIGIGTRCRKAKLNADEFRKVCNALFFSAEALDKELANLRQKARRSR